MGTSTTTGTGTGSTTTASTTETGTTTSGSASCPYESAACQSCIQQKCPPPSSVMGFPAFEDCMCTAQNEHDMSAEATCVANFTNDPTANGLYDCIGNSCGSVCGG